MTEDDIRVAMELFGGRGYDDPLRGFEREVPKPRQKPRPGLDAARFPSVGLGTDTDSQLQAIMAANERKAEDKAMSEAPLGEKIRGGLEGARLAMQAPVAGLMMPMAKLMGVPENQFYKAAFDIPETEYGQIRGGRILQGAEDIFGAMSESPLRPFVEKLPFQPFSPASAKAIDLGIEGAGKGLSLARQEAQQAGRQIMDEGQDLLRSARTDFAAPPTGAIQLQAAQAPRSQLGMYSNAEQAALNLPQAKGTGNQFLAQLSKTPGVKPAELEWTGLSDFLKARGDQSVTKAEIEQYLQANKIQVNERQLLSPSEFQAKINNEIMPGNESVRASVDEDGVVTLQQMEPFSERYLGEMRKDDLPDDILRDLNDFLKSYGVAKYSPDDDRYVDYTLPNGSNYREILLKLPNVGENISFEKWIDKYTAIRSMDDLKRDPRLMQQMRTQYERDVSRLPKEGTFRSGHYDDPNILAHMRVTDRNDADGNKVLFVEELQSDWGQSGREYGFAEKPSAEVTEYRKLLKDYEKGTLPKNEMQRFEELYAKFGRYLVDQKDNRSPSAPFVTNTEDWLNLSLKRLITDAVNNGYDKVAFINGPQSVKRYDLSKQVNEIAVPTVKADGSRYVRIDATQGKRLLLKVDKDGVVSGSDTDNQFNRKKLDEVIGKELAEKVMNAKEATSFKDLDLKVGGEGMQKFYDQIVPNTVNKLLKKLGGGKLEPVNIVNSADKPVGAYIDYGSQKWEARVGDESFGFFHTRAKALDVAREAYRKQQIQQLGFTITPEMRELVKSQGLPMFAKGGAVKGIKGGIDAAKQAVKAARRQERVDKNLQRWSGSEEKPPVYYHATDQEKDFRVFDPNKSNSQAKASFFAPTPSFTNEWIKNALKEQHFKNFPFASPRSIPAYLRVKNTFDYENPEHVQSVIGRAKIPKAFTPEYVADRMKAGDWAVIEDRNIQNAIKDQGFDSFFVKEQGIKNIGVFNPGDIKSVFNRGSYSEDPDISKAEGGAINGRARARAQAHKEASMADGGQINGRARARAQAYKNGGAVELHLGIGGDALKRAKSGVGQALKAVKGAQKRQQPAPAAPPPKREFTGSLAPVKDPVRGQTSKELVQMQRKELNDEQKEALEIFKQRYPEFARASKFMTPQEIIKTIGRESNVMQIDQLLKVIPSAKELSSVAKLGDPKRGWYRASTQAIIDVFGDDAPRFASLLAAMSPQTSVESNLINTLNTWKNWTAAGRPTDARAIRQIMGSSVQGTKGEESVLEAWAANASRVLSADDPLKVTLSGPKVDSFYRNLADDVYRVTNDAWMAGGLGVGQELFSGSPTAVQLMRGDPGLTPGYIGTSARVREAGQMANMLPSEAQETMWSVYMPLYEKQAQTDLGAREIIQRGLLTPDVIRGTPDFATLLKNPENSRILEESGYGEQLAGLRPTPFSTRGPSLSLSEQREVERAAQRLEELREGRGRESRAKTISLPKQGKPESAFAYSTYETIPGRGVGHLEGLIEEDIGKRKHFSSRAAAPFRDLQGRDVLQGALGLKPLETRTMTGAYRPEGTVPGTPYRQSLETQPGFASGVEVPLTGGLQVPKRTQQQLTAAEALRGLMTAQRGSPWNVQIPTEKGNALMAFPERNARIDPEAMRYSASIMPEDIFMADTGQGVAVVPFGKPFSRQEGKLITERLGAKRFVPTKFVGDYVDYSQELTGPQGTGAATRKMFAALDPLTGKQKSALSQAAQKPAGELYELYEQTAKSRNEPTREDLMNFLRILRDKGLPGLTAALASGQALPAEEEARKAGGLAALR